MKSIVVKFPESADIQYSISVVPEEIPVHNNIVDSGDKEYDMKTESEIIARINNGDAWAWGIVCVTGKWKFLEAHSYIGGCSYENEQDFIDSCTHLEYMKEDVCRRIIEKIKDLAR